MMAEDLARQRAERSERVAEQHRAQRQRRAQESAAARVLIERFGVRAVERGLPGESFSRAPGPGAGNTAPAWSVGTCVTIVPSVWDATGPTTCWWCRRSASAAGA